MEPPSGLGPATAGSFHDAIDHAFIFGFRIVMLICALLAVASASVSALLIPDKGWTLPRPSAATDG
jgi:hypothetical protein